VEWDTDLAGNPVDGVDVIIVASLDVAEDETLVLKESHDIVEGPVEYAARHSI
jgi:hypothetical protein